MNKVKTSLIRPIPADFTCCRALEKAADADIADLFGSLSPGEVTALVEVLIHAGKERSHGNSRRLPSSHH